MGFSPPPPQDGAYTSSATGALCLIVAAGLVCVKSRGCWWFWDLDFAEYVVSAVEVAGWEYSVELDSGVGVRVFVSTGFGS